MSCLTPYPAPVCDQCGKRSLMIGEIVTELHSRVCHNWTLEPRVWAMTKKVRYE